MGLRKRVEDLTQHERLNFLLTNRIPRRWATLAMGRVSRIENPLVRALSFALWRFFGGDLSLHEAKKQSFKSVHECFIRELKAGLRPIDARPTIAVSPCDGVVGATGRIAATELFQAKGYPYTLDELLVDPDLAEKYRNGVFVTLRLRSSMYHRFHAPLDCRVSEVLYVAGDTWNVNPIALRRVERLFCKNERAVVELSPTGWRDSIVLVPIAAILVASIRFNFLPQPLTLKYGGPNRIACAAQLAKGDELGYFEHGSTVVVLGTAGLEVCDSVTEDAVVRMGEPLLRVASG